MKNIIQDCASLSSGTIATLTGFTHYKDIERIQAELVNMAMKMTNAKSWMDVWEAYKREC